MALVALIGPELFPIPPLRGGATELFVAELAAHLRRHRPLVIGPADPALPRAETRGQAQYLRVSLNPLERWLYRRYRHLWPLYDRKVAALVRRFQPALLHVHNRPLLALNLKRWFPDLPVFLHLHNAYEILGKREKPPPFTPMPVEALVACSRYVLERERERLGTGAKTHEVVYNGVNLELFRPWWEKPSEIREIRRQLSLGDEPVVLFAGKLRESKGVGVLLAAMDRVWQQLPHTVLLLVGGTEFGRGRLHRQTPFFRELKIRVAKARGRIRLTGFVPHDHMPRVYLAGDVLAAPSQKPEGLPMVLLEGGAAGLPIVATRVGGIPELLADGENALLLNEVTDVTTLAEKILLLLTNRTLARHLGEKARQRVEERFSWPRIAEEQESLYEKFLV